MYSTGNSGSGNENPIIVMEVGNNGVHIRLGTDGSESAVSFDPRYARNKPQGRHGQGDLFDDKSHTLQRTRILRHSKLRNEPLLGKCQTYRKESPPTRMSTSNRRGEIHEGIRSILVPSRAALNPAGFVSLANRYFDI